MKPKTLAVRLIIIAIGVMGFTQISAACEAPAEPNIPNAETTVTAEMVKAQKDIKAYMAAAEAYLSCVRSSSKHNKMVTRMQEVADDFNKVVRAFKERKSRA